jgi:Uma2 family endonuclease
MTAILEKPQTMLEPHRFTVSEYHRIYESGALPREPRSQLIQGEIYFIAAMGAAHADAITVLTELLVEAYVKKAKISPQVPISIWNASEPEPDFALLKRTAPRGVATAQDVLLVIEVSDSSLKFDREKKMPEYARSGIAEAWIVNLEERQLEVYRQPSGERYLQLQLVLEGTPFAPLFAPEIMLDWTKALEDKP